MWVSLASRGAGWARLLARAWGREYGVQTGGRSTALASLPGLDGAYDSMHHVCCVAGRGKNWNLQVSRSAGVS